MNSIKRPKRGENEDDLIREQNEFLSKNKIQKVKCDINEDICNTNDHQLADNHDLPQIVCNIVEKNVDFFDENLLTQSVKQLPSVGFPKAIRRSNDLVPKRGKSLFALQMDKNKGINCETNESDEDIPYNSIVVGHGLGIQNWKNDIQNIRKENDRLIKSLDKNKILEERQELISKLSKSTIDFIKNRKKIDKSVVKPSMDSEMSKQNDQQMETDVTIDENDLPIKPIEVEEKKWLNMNVIEKKKMSWMGDLPSKLDSTQISNSARFDFEGNLTDGSKDVDIQSGLHHHGEEQSSPGYTIQDLFTFIQSSFNSQQVIGLQVFAKIFTKAYQGLFDNCFNDNVIVQLLQSSALVLITRKCIDDNTETVWMTAINALHAIICNTSIDELFLDRGFILFNDLNTDKKVEDLKPIYDTDVKLEELDDVKLSQIDLIKCLVERTAILQRIKFLFDFNKSQLESKTVNRLLDILIRISRHSSTSRKAIIESEGLLETIITNFIPVLINSDPDRVFNKPNPKALKLFRILTDCDSETTIRLVSDYPQVIESVKVYLTLNPENVENRTEILQLSIESLRVWINLLSQQLCVSEFLEMFPIVIRQLQFCQTLDPISHKNTFDFEYVSTLITVIKCLVKVNPNISAFNDIIRIVLFKWLQIIINESNPPKFAVNLTILSAVDFILNSNTNCEPLYELISKFINSETVIEKLIDSVIKSSNLVQLDAQIQGNLRDSSNLPSYGSLYFTNLENIAVLNNNSSVCLLLALVRVLRAFPNKLVIIRLKTIERYLTKVSKNLKFNVKLNLFDLFELSLLSEICLLYSSLSSTESENINCYSNVTLLMIHLIGNNEHKRDLFNRFISNLSIHSNQTIIENFSKLNLNEDFNSNSLISEPHNICFDSFNALYGKYSTMDSPHWVFDPLIKSLKKDKVLPQDIYDCLSLIDLILTNHRNYFTQMLSSSSALLCLISSVFLVSEDLFFDHKIQVLLYKILKKLLVSDGIVCKVSDKVPHFESVGDFFAQFLSQFESVSYGNKAFVNYLLVFCQMKCSPHFRKRLFSDNLTALRVVSIHFNEILLPLDCLLFPIETDANNLESYLKALLCEELDPKHSCILYLMAIHHLNHALIRSTKVLSPEVKQKFNKLIRSVENSKNDNLKLHLYNYSHFDQNSEFGICLKS